MTLPQVSVSRLRMEMFAQDMRKRAEECDVMAQDREHAGDYSRGMSAGMAIAYRCAANTIETFIADHDDTELARAIDAEQRAS